MKRLAVALIVASIVLAVASVLYVRGGAVFTQTHDAGVQDRITTRGAVVRIGRGAGCTPTSAIRVPLSQGCIYVHDNATHASVGIRALALEGCNLVIFTDAVDSVDEVIAAIAEEDETISRHQVQAGISGGGAKATVYLYRNGTRVCANDTRFGVNAANLWVQLTYLHDEVPV